MAKTSQQNKNTQKSKKDRKKEKKQKLDKKLMTDPKIKKRRRKKKPVDPLKPKAALSAYLLFGKSVRDSIKTEHPEFKSPDIMTETGRLWKALSDSDKVVFEDQNKEDKKIYTKAMESYSPSEEFKAKTAEFNKKKAKKERDPNKPKNPHSAYILFCADVRAGVVAENSDVAPKVIMTLLGAKWKETAADVRQPYEDLAAQKKEVHKVAMEAYRATLPPPLETAC